MRNKHRGASAAARPAELHHDGDKKNPERKKDNGAIADDQSDRRFTCNPPRILELSFDHPRAPRGLAIRLLLAVSTE